MTQISQSGPIQKKQENKGKGGVPDPGKLTSEENEENSGAYLPGVVKKMLENINSVIIEDKCTWAKPKADMNRELDVLSVFGRKSCFLLGIRAESGYTIVQHCFASYKHSALSLAAEFW